MEAEDRTLHYREKDGLSEEIQLYPLTIALIMVNVAIWLAGHFMPYSILQFGAISPETVFLRHQWYRLISATFLHWNVLQLICNMWALYWLGQIGERNIARWKYLMIYFISGICGALLALGVAQIRGNTGVLTAGSSGAVFGLYGTLLAKAVKRGRDAAAGKLYILSNFAPVLLIVPGLFMHGVSFSCHIGGLISGFLAGLLLIKSKKRN